MAVVGSDLLQDVAFEFYGHLIANEIHDKNPHLPQNTERWRWHKESWFSLQNPIAQIFGMAVLVAVSWVVQKYFQDLLVAKIYTKVLLNRSSKKELNPDLL